MSKQPEQWAVEQHIKKNWKCEWLCPHTKLPNLGETEPDPQPDPNKDTPNE